MMARSSLGRLARIVFISSRNLVIVSAVVAICSRRVAMTDYSLRGGGGVATARSRAARFLNPDYSGCGCPDRSPRLQPREARLRGRENMKGLLRTSRFPIFLRVPLCPLWLKLFPTSCLPESSPQCLPPLRLPRARWMAAACIPSACAQASRWAASAARLFRDR